MQRKQKKHIYSFAASLLIVSICCAVSPAKALLSRPQTRRPAAGTAAPVQSSAVAAPIVSTLPVSPRASVSVKGTQALLARLAQQKAQTAGRITAIQTAVGRKSTPVSKSVTASSVKAASLTVSAAGNATASLPKDDSLCLVVLGFQLNPDGSMQQELIDRLQILKSAALKYPEAIIVCTGGHTAANNKNVSEAGLMAEWLKNNGVDPDRILVETRALNTQNNADYTLDLLKHSQPQTASILIFTSDYHMNDGVEAFQAQARQKGSNITIAAGNTALLR